MSKIFVSTSEERGDQGSPFAVRHPVHGGCFLDRVTWIFDSELDEQLGDMPADLMGLVDDRLRFVVGL
ncbi:MAG TPA: hypothetical protein VKB69_16415 [Micromonosporaceae bacterium]|nr:hypothetical protein [Micromonosporaceae bacterium]